MDARVKPELVVGVDVGSQGTCAQALTPEGEQAAKAYVPHTLSYPHLGGRSRIHASGWAPSRRRLPRYVAP